MLLVCGKSYISIYFVIILFYSGHYSCRAEQNRRLSKRWLKITMAHTYVVSSQKSTAVHHAVACNFVSPDETNLVVVKSNNIEVLSLVSDSLILKIKTSLYGKITSLHAYRPRTSNTDVLFVLTERKHFCVLGFDPVLEVLITLARGNLKDRVGHDVESGQRALMDPENRMIGMVLYDGLLKVGKKRSFLHVLVVFLLDTQ